MGVDLSLRERFTILFKIRRKWEVTTFSPSYNSYSHETETIIFLHMKNHYFFLQSSNIINISCWKQQSVYLFLLHLGAVVIVIVC